MTPDTRRVTSGDAYTGLLFLYFGLNSEYAYIGGVKGVDPATEGEHDEVMLMRRRRQGDE